MIKHLMMSVVVVAAGLMTGCATHKTTITHTITELPSSGFAKAWSVAPELKSPLKDIYYSGDRLFVYTEKNEVVSITAGGTVTTVLSLGDSYRLGEPMGQADRFIIPIGSKLEVYSYVGYRLRSIPCSYPVRTSGAAIDQTVYAAVDSDTGGRFAAIALDRDYAVYRWTVLTGLINTQPALRDNVAYCATEDGRVYALTTGRGNYWPQGIAMPEGIFHTNGRIIAPLRVDESGVYVACTDSKLYCIDPVSGKIRWQFFGSAELRQSPVPTQDSVYQVIGDNAVAIEKKSTDIFRKAIWTAPNIKQVLGDDSKLVYALTSDNTLVALNKSDGTIKISSGRHDFVKVIANPNPKTPIFYAITTSGEILSITPITKPGGVGEIVIAPVVSNSVLLNFQQH